MNEIVTLDNISDKIFEIRNQKVMIDADLAVLYAIPTKALNQSVKRNTARFPEDFMFQLTQIERNELVTKCDRLTKLKHSSVLPYAFTENGVAMLSSVNNSERAALINIQIIRAFVRLRRMLVENDALRYAVEGLERRVGKNERDIQIAINAIQSILTPPVPLKKKQRMGFGPSGDRQ